MQENIETNISYIINIRPDKAVDHNTICIDMIRHVAIIMSVEH